MRREILANFKITSPEEFFDMAQKQSPIPGESMTAAPKTLPFDRPAQFTNPEKLVDKILLSLGSPEKTRSLLGLVKLGLPLDMITSTLMENLILEGVTNPQTAITATPAVTVILTRMAESAGLDISLTTDGKDDQITQEDYQITKLVESKDKASGIIDQTIEDLAEQPIPKKGMMNLPEELV